jgi:hypothetical protein
MVGGLQELPGGGVRFSVPVYEPFKPDPRGASHKPWLHAPFHVGPRSPRTFEGTAIAEHRAVQARIDAGPVVQEPGEAAAPYAPCNRPHPAERPI